jgi:chromosome transmission fidelity protein 8
VGYHELAGTKVTLKKPLLVLRKKKMDAGCEEQEPPEVELEVIGIIRHKTSSSRTAPRPSSQVIH